MKLNIKIDLSNAAFEENGAAEIDSILDPFLEVASTRSIRQLASLIGDSGYPLFDTNGNRVGECMLSSDEADEPDDSHEPGYSQGPTVFEQWESLAGE